MPFLPLLGSVASPFGITLSEYQIMEPVKGIEPLLHMKHAYTRKLYYMEYLETFLASIVNKIISVSLQYTYTLQ